MSSHKLDHFDYSTEHCRFNWTAIYRSSFTRNDT